MRTKTKLRHGELQIQTLKICTVPTIEFWQRRDLRTVKKQQTTKRLRSF